MPPVAVGFHCSHEQHLPSALLSHAQRAAAAGFSAAMCSDHFHPWSARQAQSGFTWAWLGSALAATPMTLGTVCAPGQRYHPAVIAQAAATVSEMYPERFWLALGSGEALNESITGEPWPTKPERQGRLEECAEIIRALWRGEMVTARGRVVTAGARLYTRPVTPPLLVGAALSPATARRAGSWADALITVAAERSTMRKVVEAFREGGGEHKPMFLQVALSFAPTDDEAERAAMERWRHAGLTGDELAILSSPEAFDRASERVTVSDLRRSVRMSSSIEQHADWIRQDALTGFSRIYLHNVASMHQERFIDACGEHRLPQGIEGAL